MAELTAQLLDRARDFLAHDPDPDTRAELEAMVERRDPELAERFAGPLAFGTAGLRGLLGAGESRMNRAVVLRTTAGIAAWLKGTGKDLSRGVVIGYDGRRQSDVFARDAAAVLLAAGISVYLSEGTCPTPLCAFALRDREALAAIMVTASHNPPDYNGYKVYAENGAQIIPPIDGTIAAAIDAAPPADEIARADLDEAAKEGRLQWLGEAMDARYLEAIGTMMPAKGGDRSLRIVYTPMHGVGAKLWRRAFEGAGFSDLHIVPEQAEPDGAFPTVAFPNPEEDGAMDLSHALARKVDAALVIANDPDADRLACSVRRGDDFMMLTGNEVGTLLGGYALERLEPKGDDRLVVSTIVSSPLLARMAEGHGARFAQTLTGFKWIANRAMELEGEGARFVFGYEEALGYEVGTAVRDKDGISAALALATHAAELHAEGKTLLDALEQIWRRFGYFTSGQRSLKFPGSAGKAQMAALMKQLREDPPSALAGLRVVAVTDCLRSEVKRGETVEPLELPKSDVLGFALEGGHRVLARPSGTEPKMKIYIDVCEPVGDGGVDQARTKAEARREELLGAILSRLGADG